MNARLLAALLLLSPAALAAQTPSQPDAQPARRTVRAAPAGGAIAVDGRLDEAAWAAAEPARDFTQSWPNPGAPASQRTEARVLYDASAIYVGVRAYDSAPDSIAAQLARRDASGIFSDWVHVVLDSYHDRRTAFRFSVNPHGVLKDVLHSDDVNEDLDWDAVWEAGTRVDSLGWTVEIRVPLSQLRYGKAPAGTERTWGLQVQRDIARYDERVSWSPWSRTDAGYVSRAGDVTGVVVPTVRRLELMPYTSARLTREPEDEGNPFWSRNEVGGSLGADVKYGLTADLTLTAAINPDFGQVEVDPAVVNLTAFETFFPEKRPFFLEGIDVFRFGASVAFNRFGWVSEYFYSRRLGRAPQRQIFERYTDVPGQTTILGAAKLTGKTASGWSIGVMDALTAPEEARFLGPDNARPQVAVEPLTNYFMSRVRRDLRGGRTVVGAMLSSTHRDLSDAALDSLLRRNAYVGGVDFVHRWGANEGWAASGYLAGSRVAGSESALAFTQASSARYFERPDADRVRFDPDRTSLTGYTSALVVAKTSGSVIGSLGYQETSPGFETNDLGFQGSADRRGLATLAEYRRDRPGSWYRNWNVFGYTNHSWNFDGDLVSDGYTLASNVSLKNFWSVSWNASYLPEVLSDRMTRGGPLSTAPEQWNANVSVNGDPRKKVSWYAYAGFGGNVVGEAARNGGVGLDIRPSSNLRVRVEPNYDRQIDTDQYVTRVIDPLAAATFGRRYVFANVKQTTLSVDTRVDWTFSPRLSFQLFMQPFVSTADFYGYKEFAQPRTFDFRTYGEDGSTRTDGGECGGEEVPEGTMVLDPDGAGAAPCFALENQDFTFRSLRGNAVLRWEYRPGSALFFVWQQERGLFTGQGEFDLDRDGADLFRDPARNVFLVKATYWIGS